MKLERILVTTDLSKEAERAFAVGDLAAKVGATIVLLHVIENVGVAPVGTAFPRPVYLPGTKEEIERARKALDELRTRFPSGVEVATDVVVVPNVAQGIVDYAVAKKCDLIALSTHGRTGVRRLIIGSVTEAVLHHARVPLVVFPPKS